MVGGTIRPGQDCYFFVYSRCFLIKSFIETFIVRSCAFFTLQNTMAFAAFGCWTLVPVGPE